MFVPASVERSVDQRIVEAAAVIPAGGALTGWAALRWQGARWLHGLSGDGLSELPVSIVSCAQGVRPQRGITISRERLNPGEIVELDGLPVAVPARAVFFEMRYAASFIQSVLAMDMAAFADLVSMDEVGEYVDSHPGWTGVPRARKVLPLCDENSWSPWETRFRMVWERAGFRRPLCNRPVFDGRGHLVGTPDLIDPESGVVGQYEGAVHLAVGQRASDVRRDHAYREVGLETVSAFSVDLADRAGLVRRLHETYARARRQRGPEAWTLRTPDWWQPAFTVQQRRALTGRARDAVRRQRERLVS